MSASFVIDTFLNAAKKKLTSAGVEVRGFLCRVLLPSE